jgi:hypothetical protein
VPAPRWITYEHSRGIPAPDLGWRLGVNQIAATLLRAGCKEVVVGKSTKPQTLPRKYKPGFLKKLDKRTRVARLVSAAQDHLHDSLGGDLSYQERSLCERIVHLEALIRTDEAAMREGEKVDVGSYRQNINALVGLYRTVGIKRRAKAVKALHEVLAAAAAEDDAQ